jgi:hypothetical protein
MLYINHHDCTRWHTAQITIPAPNFSLLRKINHPVHTFFFNM